VTVPLSSSRPVVIVGSGICGTALAWQLARRGVPVLMLEQGPPVDYPHADDFTRSLYGLPTSAAGEQHRPVRQRGDYRGRLDRERASRVGGMATRWAAICPRLRPEDFLTRSRFGYGRDWPFGYDELEPFYVEAERLLGVAGTTADNPFAAPRSAPYPLPPFPLARDDLLLAAQLARADIAVHTTPQARTSASYDGRPTCANFGLCGACPTGARYSPNHHLEKLRASPSFQLWTGTRARRVIVERGRAVGVLCRRPGSRRDVEVGARRVVVAAGAIETVRLLLASGGLGDRGGRLGRGFQTHAVWAGHLDYPAPLFPGRAGFPTAESHQFLSPPGRGRHGGVKIELFSAPSPEHHGPAGDGAASAAAIVRGMEPLLRCRSVRFHCELIPKDEDAVALADERDRDGDPLAQVTLSLTDRDRETHRFAQRLLDRIAVATGATERALDGVEAFHSGFHHLGGAGIGPAGSDAVLDPWGGVQGVEGLHVVGGASFVTAGPLNPTLTMVALTVRTARRIGERA
jgi:choline dehydrogenase-like flavoprotein